MKIFHTSDWHIGRTFHTHPTLTHFRIVAEAMAQLVASESVDVVVVSGDIFDSAMPSAEAYSVLGDILRGLRRAGASVLLISGNHDSATRLGFQSEWAGLGGIHVLTRHQTLEIPVTLDDEHGPVHFYGIPYLEPALIRHHYPDEPLRSHEQALGFAMRRINGDRRNRPGRSVVMAHCFTSGVRIIEGDPERDITAGGLNLVSASIFDGPDYIALGHIHGKSHITSRVRYSGAPLHYSFSETGKARGGWMVTLDAAGLASVEWRDLPVPRPVTELTGSLDDLLVDSRYEPMRNDWVKANLTDRARPYDAMRKLHTRFPHCVSLEYRPEFVADSSQHSYGERIDQQSDLEIVGGFVEYVRNGVEMTAFERRLTAELLAEQALTR